jgi:hypothetical protein
MGNVEDYLVTLQDLNHTVASGGQGLRDKVKVQLPDNIINMIYIAKLIPEDDNAIL